MGGQGDDHGQQHRADADRIDVIKMGALELDARRRQAQGLVDEQIRRDRAEPGHGNDREDAQCLFK